jgi:hypothetical protein
MIKIKNLCIAICLFVFTQVTCKIIKIPDIHIPPHILTSSRESSVPYISGDTFRAFCDFIIDGTQSTVNTDLVKDGDTIFLSPNPLLISFFFKEVHPFIKKKYILVTHNSSRSVPGEFYHYLDDDKLIAWFGLDCDNNSNPKFIPIPEGIANQYWPHGNIKTLTQALQHINKTERPWLVYLNGSKTHKERSEVANFFSDKPWCIKGQHKPYSEYLKDVAQAKFILCPRGSGIDCHRQWEAMLLGTIPIIKHSTIDSVFEGLPVVLINEWSEVTEEFLKKTYTLMKNQSFKMDRMFAEYWLHKIETLKKSFSIKSKK